MKKTKQKESDGTPMTREESLKWMDQEIARMGGKVVFRTPEENKLLMEKMEKLWKLK